LDCDDLSNLDVLFDYVGSHTHILCALMSKELLFRPWCVGELITAKLKGVATTRIIFGDFTLLDEKSIHIFDELVDISVLGQHGMNLEIVQTMLRYLSSLPEVILPNELTTDTQRRLVKALMGVSRGSQLGAVQVNATISSEDIASNKRVQTSKVAIITNDSHIDSVAAALVVCRFLGPYTMSQPDMAPYIWNAGVEFPLSCTTCVVLLSAGIFSYAPFLTSLRMAARKKISFILIIAEEGFAYPTAESKKEMLKYFSSMAASGDIAEDPDVLIRLICDLFKEFAIVFAPNCEEEHVLKAKAGSIASRLMRGGLQKLELPANKVWLV